MIDSQIDWNIVWKRLINNEGDEHQNRAERKNRWDSKENALDYLNGFLMRSREHPERIEEMLQKFPLSPEFRVLDIGSGSGNVAIPMSARVAHITAVEPGKGMMEVLKEQITEHRVTNITTIPKRWEDVNIARDLDGPYDLVIASHSLGMPDIRDAITKMCAASRKWVYLFWDAGISTWEQRMIDLWPMLHMREHQSGPKADILYHLLYDMGIYPNVKTDQQYILQTYPDMESAVHKFRKSFYITTPEQEKIMRDYLKATLEMGENGYFHRQRYYPTMLWWDVSEIENRVRNLKKP
ncbi:MAG: class I SAM-dependent methyltransferase [Methanoregula sp.]|nr:class I SAM-dependent methyltransferase [Methanoregula sp.]